ncbi:MAG TPA: hypothetical protein DGT23_31650 [Micromonosporaceae bacterium]|nr:hypothetical protein [Micromonosporaceae bacterium]
MSAALVLALAAPSTATTTVHSGLQAALDRITAAGMPGTFAEVRNGYQTDRAASGVADIDTGRRTQPGMRHRIGSITKTFVAATLLQLVWEGRLVLDAPVARYLPQYSTPGVTVRMLLNHTSGIGDYDTELFKTPEDVIRYRHTTFRNDHLARLGLDAPRTGPPGGPFSYSNTNYVLAGMILEKVTGHSAVYEINKRILWRLGLHHTYFAGSTSHIFGPHSKAYIPWTDGELMDFSVYNMSWGWMVGDVVSTTNDLNRFFRALLTGKVLGAAELAQMQTVVPFDPEQPFFGGYGLGLYTLPLCGDVWGHDGLVFGHATISLHSADGSRQITLAQNMTHYAPPGEPDPIAEATGQLIGDALCEDQTASRQLLQGWRSPLPQRVLTH